MNKYFREGYIEGLRLAREIIEKYKSSNHDGTVYAIGKQWGAELIDNEIERAIKIARLKSGMNEYI